MVDLPQSELPLRGDWLFPTEIRFGAGRLAELGALCRRHGIMRPLLVTDRGLAQLPLTQRVIEAARKAGIAPQLFAEVQENPTDENVRAGAAAFRDAKADGVIALGGGSGLDCGKSIAVLGGLGGDLKRFISPDHELGARERGVPPIIAIPTTAGTGAEIEIAAVITDTASRVKIGVWHPEMLPKVAIADPEMTLSLPRHLTAATAMDALIHNLEALCVPMFHPMADAIAIDGVLRVGKYLPMALDEPNNIVARAHLLAASLAGATAFGKGLGAVHALSHAIGARLGTHHGLTNAVLLPFVLDFNEPKIGPALRAIADALGLAGEKVAATRAWLDHLARTAGIPENLGALGVTRAQIPELAEIAAADVCATTNPVPLDVKTLVGILAKAMG